MTRTTVHVQYMQLAVSDICGRMWLCIVYPNEKNCGISEDYNFSNPVWQMSGQEGSCSAIVWEWSAINTKTNNTVGSIASSLYGEKTEDKTDARKDAESATTRLWR